MSRVLKSQQKEAISTVVSRKDLLAVFPACFGKILIFQVLVLQESNYDGEPFQHSCRSSNQSGGQSDMVKYQRFNEYNWEVTTHRPNFSTLLSSVFIRDDLIASTRGSFKCSLIIHPFFLTRLVKMVDLREKLTCYIRSYTRSSMEATKIFESNRIGPLVAIWRSPW